MATTKVKASIEPFSLMKKCPRNRHDCNGGMRCLGQACGDEFERARFHATSVSKSSMESLEKTVHSPLLPGHAAVRYQVFKDLSIRYEDDPFANSYADDDDKADKAKIDDDTDDDGDKDEAVHDLQKGIVTSQLRNCWRLANMVVGDDHPKNDSSDSDSEDDNEPKPTQVAKTADSKDSSQNDSDYDSEGNFKSLKRLVRAAAYVDPVAAAFIENANQIMSRACDLVTQVRTTPPGKVNDTTKGVTGSAKAMAEANKTPLYGRQRLVAESMMKLLHDEIATRQLLVQSIQAVLDQSRVLKMESARKTLTTQTAKAQKNSKGRRDRKDRKDKK